MNRRELFANAIKAGAAVAVAPIAAPAEMQQPEAKGHKYYVATQDGHVERYGPSEPRKYRGTTSCN